MEKLQDKVCVLICWGISPNFNTVALMVMYNTAERQYFIQNNSLTWNEARNYCQVCFTDLVTLSHDNIEIIVKSLSSQHWIGLRKSFNSTSNYTGNISMSWSHWSNGEPLTFQNWYPGWPLFKPSVPDVECCGCSCNEPAATTDITDLNVTDFTTSWETITDMTVTEDYMNVTSSVFTDATLMMTTPLPTPAVSVTSDGYIEDSCVAMFSFGPWVEKNCWELLPFICYEDHSPGYFKVNVTSITSESATVTWEQVPGGISHYRVGVKGDKELNDSKTDRTHNLVNLTAGTCYVVHVFPVKCERELNPENVAFYTKPNKVENFTVTKVTETSIQVSWSKPAGNVDFYVLRGGSRPLNFTTEGGEVDGLTPGSCYTLTVLSGVKDYSMWSEESNITAYTKPSTVSNLSVSDNSNHSLFLHWDPPVGDFTGFSVKAINNHDQDRSANARPLVYQSTTFWYPEDSSHDPGDTLSFLPAPSWVAISFNVLFEVEVNRTVCEVPVTNLPMGTELTLVVLALANNSLQGDNTTILTYTAPASISSLTVITSHNSLDATWTIDEGNDSYFTVKLLLDGKVEEPGRNVTETRVTFDDLKTAANYTVVVYAVSGHLRSLPMEVSKFTLPSPPTNAIATFVNKSAITFKWTAPENIAKATYLVKLSSDFYGQSWSAKISEETSYTFSNLTSGTKYCFEVYVLAGELTSPPERNCNVKTEPEERQIILSMLCSSAISLHCDNSTTRTHVFEQLHDHFSKLLKDDIVWALEATEE